MQILHLAASPQGLLAWSETDQFQALSTGTLHPFAKPPTQISKLLLNTSSAYRNLSPEHRLRVTLPSSASAPLPSRPIPGLPPAGPEAGLKDWRIRALLLSPLQALNLLLACEQDQLRQVALEGSHEVTYWTTATRFALSLVAASSFAPRIVSREQDTQALWEPVIPAESIAFLHQMASAMPPAARAVSQPGKSQLQPFPPLQVIRSFVNMIVDQTVRLGLQRVPPVPNPRTGTTRIPTEHDDLIHALTKPQPHLQSGPRKLKSLTGQVQQWRAPIDLTDEHTPRLCLRVHPPDAHQQNDPSDVWEIQYLLQDPADPANLVPAEQIWDPPEGDPPEGRSPEGLPPAATPQSLLAQLRRAAEFSSTIAHSLRHPRPSSTRIDTIAFHGFLSQQADDLTQQGFQVMMPEGWSRSSRSALKLDAAIVPAGGSGVGLAAIMDFHWQAALGEQQISDDDMDLLAATKLPLVRVANQWVDINNPQMQATIQRWRSRPLQATAWQVIQQIIDPLEDDDTIQPTGWLLELISQLTDRSVISLVDPPATLTGELHPYQHRGYSWLRWITRWGLGACLADDMGLGKTIQALAFLLADRLDGNLGAYLIVCPSSLIANWLNEIAKFAPVLRTYLHHGARRAQTREELDIRAAGADIVLTTYPLLQRDADLLSAAEWRATVLDEAQNIKNPDTHQARAVRRLSAALRIALTGTPVENHVGELWSIMHFLNPGLLGSRESFRANFLLPIRAHDDPEAAERLHAICAPFVLRRMKTDPDIAPDLPGKHETRVTCHLTTEQASLYSAVISDLENRLENARGIARLGIIFSATTKLKQVCNHPAQLIADDRDTSPSRSGKLSTLIEMITAATASGAKSLVFTQYVKMGHILQQQIALATGTTVPFLNGSTSVARRGDLVDDFQTNDDVRIMIVSVKAGGNGLNLTAATNVFHYDRWWNPAVENQASDRAFRIGQTKDVHVNKLVCAGTLEEKIDHMLEQKSELAGRMIRSGDDWITKLSDHELRDVLALAREQA